MNQKVNPDEEVRVRERRERETEHLDFGSAKLYYTMQKKITNKKLILGWTPGGHVLREEKWIEQWKNYAS